MANQDHGDDTPQSNAAIAERRRPNKSSRAERKGSRVAGVSGSQERSSGRPQSTGKRSFFEVYKSGQGKYTRMCSGIGAAVLILGLASYVFDQMLGLPWSNEPWFVGVRVAVPVALIILLGLLSYWLIGVHRGSADFMIATEGEMKKVNWSTKKEILGSTKVVIVSVIILSVMLFIVDVAFMAFFIAIGVLKSNVLQRIFSPPQT